MRTEASAGAMAERELPLLGSVGGSANEQGSEFRGLVGAIIAGAILTDSTLSSMGLEDLDLHPAFIIAEADGYVDDLVTGEAPGRRILIQAKLSTGLGQTSMALAVHQFAGAIKHGLAADDRLVLATAHPTGEVARLATLLKRERYPEAEQRSAAERMAADKLIALAERDLDPSGVQQLFDQLIIWRVEPVAFRFALSTRLEAGVTAQGSGPAGVDALIGIVRSLAQIRAGGDAASLVAELTRRKVPLAGRYDASAAVARARALIEHRERVRGRGERLELFGIGGALGSLPLRDADCHVHVGRAGDSRDSGRELSTVVRRHARVLLIGQPGGGKSTALRALAATAARSADWPTPVVVHVGRLVTTDAPLTDRLLELAAADALPQDRPTLRAALAQELAAGRVLLVLDGFDELGSRRWAGVAQQLDHWLATLRPEVEVVLATRPVAGGVEAAGALGLVSYELRPPDHPWTTVRTILEAVDAGEDSEWVSRRADWVSSAFTRDRVLKQRPLMVVILAVIASQAHDPDELPRSRAKILLKALRDLPRRWEVERRDGALTIGELNDTDADVAVSMTLQTLCVAALTWADVSQEAIITGLASELASGFGLKPARSRAAAIDALDFWVRAGVFAVEDDRLMTRIRPLAEVGLAEQWADTPETERDRLIAQARADPALGEVLRLAAGLTRGFAERWTRAVALDGTADELVALVDACREAEPLHDDIVAELLARFPASVDEPEDAEVAGEALALLAVSDGQREWLEGQILSAVSEERRLMMSALLTCMWDRQGPEADELLREFVRAPWPVPIREPSDTDETFVIYDNSADGLYQHAHEQTVLRVATISAEDAQLAVDNYHAGNVHVGHELRVILLRLGQDDLAARIDEQWKLNWDDGSREGPEVTAQVCTWLAQLAEPPALSFADKRRLQELADLFGSTACNWLRPRTLARDPDEVRGWVIAIARLAGFDLPLLAAQARFLAAELAAVDDEAEARFFIYEHGQTRLVENWTDVTDPEPLIDDLVGALGVVPQQASHALMHAFHACPDPELVVARVKKQLPNLLIWAANLAARIIIVCLAKIDTERAFDQALVWCEHEEPMVRCAAASWLSAGVRSKRSDDRGWRRCLQDDDWSVRRAALSALDGVSLTDEQQELVRALPEAPPGEWTCTRCATVNPSTSACRTCHTQAPRLRERVGEILDPQPEQQATDLSLLFELPGERPHIRRGPQDWE